MESILMAGHFDSLAEFVEYTNDLVGDELVGFEGYTVRKVLHFQILLASSGIDTVVLVEVAYSDPARYDEGNFLHYGGDAR